MNSRKFYTNSSFFFQFGYLKLWKLKQLKLVWLRSQFHILSLSFNSYLFSIRQASLSAPHSSRIRYRLATRRWLNFSSASFSCSHVLTDDEVPQDVSGVVPDCSIPVVHIKFDILEAEPLSLLAEATFVDGLLTALPRRSKMPLQLTQLIQMDYMLAIIVGGPLVGKLTDYSPRIPSSTGLNIVQVAAQLLSVNMIIYVHIVSSTSASPILLRPWLLVLVLAGTIERLCAVALGVAMGRDWVVLLAGINRPIALAQANAVLNRIDLLCEIAGASLFGILRSKYDPVTCLKFAARLMIWSFPVMTGAAGWVFQASLLTLAVAAYWSGALSQQSPLLFFLGLIVMISFVYIYMLRN